MQDLISHKKQFLSLRMQFYCSPNSYKKAPVSFYRDIAYRKNRVSPDVPKWTPLVTIKVNIGKTKIYSSEFGKPQKLKIHNKSDGQI